MKSSILFVVLLVSCLPAKSEVPVFGNFSNDSGNAFSIAANSSGETFGGAVGFTPTTDLSISSVTLWLNGYTGQNGQSFEAEIFQNTDDFGQGNQPGEVIAALTTPAPNNGSTASFNFSDSSGSLTLNSGQEYWLAIFGVTPSPEAGYVSAQWVDGGAMQGAAVYDGAEGFSAGLFYDSSATPAFTLNSSDASAISMEPVPEPSSMALLIVPAMLGVCRKLSQRQKTRS